MIIKKKFQGEPKDKTDSRIQVENGVNYHRPFRLNLNGFNRQNPQKPGRNLAENEKTVYGENHISG